MTIEYFISRDSTDPKDEILFLESDISTPDSSNTIALPEDQSGAVNDDGSINWDCPCLGGMANGPCGENFKAAFSCFVHSEAEPKGVDCIELFKSMQDCFREHPELYGDIDGDDDDGDKAAVDVAVGTGIESDDTGEKPVLVA